MKRALGFAFLAEALTALCMVTGFKLAFVLWGSAGFGEWMLARRLLSFVVPLATLGLEVAIPRYVAIARAGEGEFSAAEIMAAALRIGLATCAALLVLMFGFRDAIAAAAFGSSAYAPLLIPTGALVAVYALHVLVYAYLRGSSRAAGSSGLHVAVHGLVPLAVFALRPASVASALAEVALMTLGCSLAAAAYVVRRDRLALRAPAPHAARALFRYGRSRMAAALGLLLLATFPAAYTARTAGMEHAGVIALGLSLIGMAGSAATPIGVALLPAAAVHFARRGSSRLPTLSSARALAAAASALGTLLAFWFAPVVASTFVDAASGAEAALALRICALGAGPYFFFCCTRTLVDAQTVEAVNARVVLLALAWFLGALAVTRIALDLDPALAAVSSYVVACWALAGGIWRALSRAFAGAEPARAAGAAVHEARTA